MNLTINIDWQYFLGIMGSLILIAWYTSARFTKVETDLTWIKKLMNDLKIGSDNKSANAFASQSPVSLTDNGEKILNESGLKSFIDSNQSGFFEKCEEKREKNPYKIQQYIFDLFDTYKFPDEQYKMLQEYAFDRGISIEILRRVGAIYFRDICLKEYGHKKEEIDQHDPDKK